VKFWQALSYERTEDLPQLAGICEELGFEGVLLADHVIGSEHPESVYPYSYNDGGADFVAHTEFPDPFSAISAMAVVTTRLRFNTQIFVAPLRHPVLLAKAIATASVFSGGRVALGAGVGWMREEFVTLGEEFAGRGRRLDEMIEVMRKLWTGEMVEHHGEFYDFGPSRMLPPPIGRVPIMVGGLHPRVLARAGTLCDGWISPGNTPEELSTLMATIEEHREKAGRASEPFEYIVPATEPGELEAYASLGDSRIAIVNHPLGFSLGAEASLDERSAALEDYAKNVIERYRD